MELNLPQMGKINIQLEINEGERKKNKGKVTIYAVHTNRSHLFLRAQQFMAFNMPDIIDTYVV